VRWVTTLLALGTLVLLPGVATASELQLLPQPRRLVDTQPDSGFQGAGQPLRGLTNPRCYQIAGQVGVPAGAAGVVANLTAVGHSVNGWITLFPEGSPIPDTSNLNFDTDVEAVANMVMVPLGPSGQLCAVGQAGTNLLLDVIGYLESDAPPSGLSCPGASTLELMVTCVVDQSGMRDRTGVYVIPNDAERADFGRAARAMLGGGCADIVLGDTLTGRYSVRRFTDASNGKRYCVLMEVGDSDGNGKIDKSWGTFIVDSAATGRYRENDRRSAIPPNRCTSATRPFAGRTTPTPGRNCTNHRSSAQP